MRCLRGQFFGPTIDLQSQIIGGTQSRGGGTTGENPGFERGRKNPKTCKYPSIRRREVGGKYPQTEKRFSGEREKEEKGRVEEPKKGGE